MAWINITAAAFANTLLSAEKAALDAVGLPSGVTASEMLAEQITNTANFVRMHCPPHTARGDGETIPDELLMSALAVLRKNYFARFPKLNLWTEARNQDHLQALEVLKEWSKGRLQVVPPETPAADDEQASSAASAELITTRPRRYSRTTLDGL